MSTINYVELGFSLLQSIFLLVFVGSHCKATLQVSSTTQSTTLIGIILTIINIIMVIASWAITFFSIKEIANDEDEHRSISEEKQIKNEQKEYNKWQFILSIIITIYLIGFVIAINKINLRELIPKISIPKTPLYIGLAGSSIATIILTAMTKNSSS